MKRKPPLHAAFVRISDRVHVACDGWSVVVFKFGSPPLVIRTAEELEELVRILEERRASREKDKS